MRYKIILSYDGGPFCGWQRQTNAPSVQQALEEALSILLREGITVVGAGRTDAGVNARNYVAHFDCGCTEIDTDRLRHKLNAILPPAIAILSIAAAPEDFHARFGAVLRQYQYFIHSNKDPFAPHSWYCRYNLDLDRMNRACGYLVGTHDCSCFEKKGSDNETSVCNIFSAEWIESAQASNFPDAGSLGNGGLIFTIEANRFLRNMVRAIVGTMIDIGRGVHEPEYIMELLNGGTRNDAGQSVPGHALFLTKIEY